MNSISNSNIVLEHDVSEHDVSEHDVSEHDVSEHDVSEHDVSKLIQHDAKHPLFCATPINPTITLSATF